MAPLKSNLQYTIRRSARARRVRVTVDGAGEVIVTLPKKAAERRAAEAVKELRPWIDRRRSALLRAAEEVQREPGTLPYLGATLRVVAEPGRERVHRRGDVLLVPPGDAARGDRALLPAPRAGGDRPAAGRRHRPRRAAATPG